MRRPWKLRGTAKNEGILSAAFLVELPWLLPLKLKHPSGEKEKQIVVVILPDSGERYLSTASSLRINESIYLN